MRRIEGTSISPGLASGPPVFVQGIKLNPEEFSIQEGDLEREYVRFTDSVAQTKAELLRLRDKTAEEIGEAEAEIFDAHLLVLEDPLLHMEVQRKLEEQKRNLESVLASVIEDLTRKFAMIKDEVMRERSADIADVGQLLIRNLMGRDGVILKVEAPSILVATDIPPTTAAKLDADFILGCVTEAGSSTSHTAILTRALGIPAVVVPAGTIAEIQGARSLVVDGIEGVVVADPDPAVVEQTQKRQQRLVERELTLRRRTGLDATTTDGVKVKVAANLESPGEIALAKECGASGVGLFRTEFLFMNRRHLPDEEEQYHHYRVLAESFAEGEVIVRTIDIGGDKFLTSTGMPEEVNPYLGMRAIRFSLKRPAIFKVQLRAILRAAQHGRIKIMLPMIACLEEVSGAMGILAECASELKMHTEAVDVGVMIETPAAALTAETLARYMDFFSIGTNDLIQYTMAAERGNEQLEYLNRPAQPAVIKSIRMVSQAAQSVGIPLSVCGEMAGDLRMIPVLLGLGITELSMNPRCIPMVKEFIRRISVEEARILVEELSDCKFTRDAASLIDRRFGGQVRELELDGTESET